MFGYKERFRTQVPHDARYFVFWPATTKATNTFGWSGLDEKGNKCNEGVSFHQISSIVDAVIVMLFPMVSCYLEG